MNSNEEIEDSSVDDIPLNQYNGKPFQSNRIQPYDQILNQLRNQRQYGSTQRNNDQLYKELVESYEEFSPNVHQMPPKREEFGPPYDQSFQYEDYKTSEGNSSDDSWPEYEEDIHPENSDISEISRITDSDEFSHEFKSNRVSDHLMSNLNVRQKPFSMNASHPLTQTKTFKDFDEYVSDFHTLPEDLATEKYPVYSQNSSPTDSSSLLSVDDIDLTFGTLDTTSENESEKPDFNEYDTDSEEWSDAKSSMSSSDSPTVSMRSKLSRSSKSMGLSIDDSKRIPNTDSEETTQSKVLISHSSGSSGSGVSAISVITSSDELSEASSHSSEKLSKKRNDFEENDGLFSDTSIESILSVYSDSSDEEVLRRQTHQKEESQQKKEMVLDSKENDENMFQSFRKTENVAVL